MSTGDVLTKHTIDTVSLHDLIVVKVPVLSANGTNDTYVKKTCLKGLLSIEDSMDVDALDFLIHVPFMLVMILLGFFGNSLITWVLWRQQRRTLTGGLLSMVALTDNFVLLFYLLHFTLPTMYEYGKAFENYYIYYAWSKVYIWFGYVTSRTMSIYAVVLVVANRYLSVACTKAIAYLRKINYAKLGVALVIAFSILVNFPQILLFESVPYYDPCGEIWMSKIEKSGLLHNKRFIVAYQLLFHLFMLYFFPSMVLIFCLIKLLPYTKRKRSLPPTNVEETLDAFIEEDVPDDHVNKHGGATGSKNVTPGPASSPPGKSLGTPMLQLKGLNKNYAPSSRPSSLAGTPLMKRPGQEGTGSSTTNLRRQKQPRKEFSDGDVESPAIVNERIVAVIHAFLFMHSIAIIFHVIITGTRLNGPRMGTGNKTSMVLSEFHEMILGCFSAIKFYLYIFIGKRYWNALQKTLKLCTNSKCKWCKKNATAEERTEETPNP